MWSFCFGAVEVLAHVFCQVAEVEAVLVLNDLFVVRILVPDFHFLSQSGDDYLLGILGVDAGVRSFD